MPVDVPVDVLVDVPAAAAAGLSESFVMPEDEG
jgi:hypothetical protein